MTGAAPRLAVLGAGGRVGSLLRASGALPGAIWFSRRGGEGVQAWDLLADPAPPAALRGAEVMICLAGAVGEGDLDANRRLALAAADAAAAAGIGHLLIASSIAVYGAEGAPWREDTPPRPHGDYGRAKLKMEAALLSLAGGGEARTGAEEAPPGEGRGAIPGSQAHGFAPGGGAGQGRPSLPAGATGGPARPAPAGGGKGDARGEEALAGGGGGAALVPPERPAARSALRVGSGQGSAAVPAAATGGLETLARDAGRYSARGSNARTPPGDGALGALPATVAIGSAAGALALQPVGEAPSLPAGTTGGAASLALAGRGAASARTESGPSHAAAACPQICVLRLGNVVGADALSAAILGARPVLLDRCAGGAGPVRSVIGPVTLAQVLLALAVRAVSGAGLPAVLNVAQPGPVAMAALCAAAGRGFGWRAPGPATLPLAALETAALQALVPLPAADPAALIAEWRAAGGLP